MKNGFWEEAVANMSPAAAKGGGLTVGFGSTEAEEDQDLSHRNPDGMGPRSTEHPSGSLLPREAETGPGAVAEGEVERGFFSLFFVF